MQSSTLWILMALSRQACGSTRMIFLSTSTLQKINQTCQTSGVRSSRSTCLCSGLLMLCREIVTHCFAWFYCVGRVQDLGEQLCKSSNHLLPRFRVVEVALSTKLPSHRIPKTPSWSSFLSGTSDAQSWATNFPVVTVRPFIFLLKEQFFCVTTHPPTLFHPFVTRLLVRLSRSKRSGWDHRAAGRHAFHRRWHCSRHVSGVGTRAIPIVAGQ